MEKLNIAEILKDCPKGMELDCTMFENVKFTYIKEDSTFPIRCFIENDNSRVSFTEYGEFNMHPNSKCVIFPKGKTTWEGFKRPFKEGDILTNKRGSICIYKGPMYYNELLVDFYCGYRISDGAFISKLFKDKHFGNISEYRFATEEEKQKLFDAIKASGYKWNPETKTLEKLIEPKFKVGDIIQYKDDGYKVKITEVNIEDRCYEYESITVRGISSISFAKQDDWKLVPNKFDITTLKPFDSKVLVRTEKRKWVAAFYSHYDKDSLLKHCVVGGLWYEQCIPYNSNEHLLNTTNDCDEYFKTWE